MEILDNDKVLLYIEPPHEKKSELPVNDEMAQMVRMAIQDAEKGTMHLGPTGEVSFHVGRRTKGFHVVADGETSANYDLKLPNGMITNSLAVYYLMFYRDAIPQSEIEKVKKVCEYYGRVFNK